MNKILKSYPFSILLLASMFFIFPFLIFFFTAIFYSLKDNYNMVFYVMQPIQYFFCIISFIIFIGLLAKKKFAYYFFLIFLASFFIYNLWMIGCLIYGKRLFLNSIQLTNSEVFINVFTTFFLLSYLFYFLRKEISAPYLSIIDRGWRKKHRETKPVKFFCESNNIIWHGITINISNTGALIPLPKNSKFKEGDQFKINLTIENKEDLTILANATIIRIENYEAGIKFDFLNPNSKNYLNKFLKRIYSPRFICTNNVEFGKADYTEKSNLVDISYTGMFIEGKTPLIKNEKILIKIKTEDFGDIELIGLVKWNNKKLLFEKPEGIGVKICWIKNKIKFILWMYKKRFINFYKR